MPTYYLHLWCDTCKTEGKVRYNDRSPSFEEAEKAAQSIGWAWDIATGRRMHLPCLGQDAVILAKGIERN
jgi:hypothetical protein